jgi:hypothetical protein
LGVEGGIAQMEKAHGGLLSTVSFGMLLKRPWFQFLILPPETAPSATTNKRPS